MLQLSIRAHLEERQIEGLYATAKALGCTIIKLEERQIEGLYATAKALGCTWKRGK